MTEFDPTNVKDETKTKIDQFIEYHLKKNNRLVFITSGGSTVPLEAKTVRFIDNFSMGTRGSVSAEQFIKKNYAVLFLHRKRSLTPYERKFHNTNLLDLMHYTDESHESFQFETTNKINMKELFDTYNDVKEKNLLLKVEYNTIFDYLSLLDYTSNAIKSLKSSALVYLAAAVSDFYIPKNELPTHKIQSGSGNLILDLKPVPKCMGKLKAGWCPDAYIVSFKLETDISLLNSKCKRSLDKYKQDLVVGNILEDRKNSVSIMKANGEVTVLNLASGVEEIEEQIIEFLANAHTEFINSNE